MTDEQARVYIFLSGAEMHPTTIRADFPEARFVARARVHARPGEISPPFATALEQHQARAEIWGILISWPNAPVNGALRETITDDGRTFQAVPGALPMVGGAPADALAQARYWELPPAYVARLHDALATTGSATSDDD
jgi:hypothetical protein